MVYGFNIIGREYYSEWGFESISKAKENLEKIAEIFEGKKEIFEKHKQDIKIIKVLD